MASSSKVTPLKEVSCCPECKDSVRDDTPDFDGDPAIQCEECHQWLHQWCAGLNDERFAEFQNDESLSFYCSKCEEQSVQKPRAKKRKSHEFLFSQETKKPKRQQKRIDEVNDSKEEPVLHDILKKLSAKIVHSFSKDPIDMMLALNAHGFISNGCFKRVSTETDEEKQALLLYNACQCEIEHFPQQFETLVSILKDKDYTKILLVELFHLETGDNDEIQLCQPSKGVLLTDRNNQSAASSKPQDNIITATFYWKIPLSSTHITGHREIIAILDTGIKSDVLSVINPFQFDENNYLDEDPNAHGSKVAIVAGSRETLNSIDNTLYTYGVAPGAQLAIFKVSEQAGVPYDANKVHEHLTAIYEHNNNKPNEQIRLVVMPFRLLGILYELEREIETMLGRLELQGVICVVAAGNDGKNASPNFPATSDKVLTVGSVDAFGNFSNFSSNHDCINVLGLGTNVLFGHGEDWCPITDNGTSFAAPAVAGLIARLFECARTYDEDGETLRRLSYLPALKKFLKKNLCEGKLLQPEKVSKFFMNPENIAGLAKNLD